MKFIAGHAMSYCLKHGFMIRTVFGFLGKVIEDFQGEMGRVSKHILDLPS